MKKRYSILASALCVSLLTGCSTGGISKSSENAFVSGSGSALVLKPSDRKPAPDISSRTLSGATFTLSKSTATVINVWASWCAPCRAEAPVLEDFAAKNPAIQFVGILTRDNNSAAQDFVDRFKVTYPIATDDSVLTKFRGSLIPDAIPTTIVIDAQGRVAARISGEVTVDILQKVLESVTGGTVNA